MANLDLFVSFNDGSEHIISQRGRIFKRNKISRRGPRYILRPLAYTVSGMLFHIFTVWYSGLLWPLSIKKLGTGRSDLVLLRRTSRSVLFVARVIKIVG